MDWVEPTSGSLLSGGKMSEQSAAMTLASLLYVSGAASRAESFSLAYTIITVMEQEGYVIVPKTIDVD